MKRIAVKLGKICNDLRLLAAGPRAGFAVIGGDLTVTLAASAGQLQLNAMLPIAFGTLFSNIDQLRRSVAILESRCIRGISANPTVTAAYVEQCLSLATALVPRLGYALSSDIAREALQKKTTLRAVVLARGLLPASEVDQLLKPSVLLLSA